MDTIKRLPYWLLILLLGGVFFLWHASADDTYGLILQRVASGIVVTLRVTLISFLCAFLLAIGLVLMQRANRLCREFARFNFLKPGI